MDGMVQGNGGHRHELHGQAGHGHLLQGEAGHRAAGAARAGGGARAEHGDFGVFTRNARRIFVKDQVTESLHRKFMEFKQLLVENHHVAGNDKVCINMKTRIVSILKENGAKEYLDLSKLNTAAQESLKIVSLVHQMGTDLINSDVLSKIDKHQESAPENRHLLGNSQEKNGFAGAIKGLTKTRMTNHLSLIAYPINHKTLIAGASPDHKILDKINRAERKARDSIQVINGELEQLRAERVQDKQKIAKLEQEIQLLRKNGLIEIICMLRARLDTDIQNGGNKEQLSSIYLTDIKAYFEDQRANGHMGTHTKNGLILTPSDHKLAALIVATACFVDNSQRDLNKHYYHDFMAKNGYFHYENLGQFNLLFSEI